jgi:hypothetical protein
VQVGVERPLLVRVFEALRAQPAAARDAPGLVRHPQAVAQQELARAVPIAHAVQARVLARPDQVAQRLDLLAGHRDRLKQPTSVQPREPARVARIVLTRSPGRTGTSPGATTSHAIPRASRYRARP